MNVTSIVNNFSFNRTQVPVNTIGSYSANTLSNTYKFDRVSISAVQPVPVPDQPFDQQPPPQPPYQEPSFFNRPEVRLTGMVLGSGLAFGAVGAAIGAAAGNIGLGIAIGAGIGVIAPIAMVAYAISKFT